MRYIKFVFKFYLKNVKKNKFYIHFKDKKNIYNKRQNIFLKKNLWKQLKALLYILSEIFITL